MAGGGGRGRGHVRGRHEGNVRGRGLPAQELLRADGAAPSQGDTTVNCQYSWEYLVFCFVLRVKRAIQDDMIMECSESERGFTTLTPDLDVRHHNCGLKLLHNVAIVRGGDEQCH